MTTAQQRPPAATAETRWYAEVTRYEWLVLIIASAGWVFDAFEGQVFNITRNDMLKDLLNVPAGDPLIAKWGDYFLSAFLAGGTFGGLLFGSLGDRFGRRPIMNLTILFYSIFSGLTYFATDLWQIAVLRFLVAMGVGGEWAVAAALVAEVFPQKARAHASGIFHATSVLGVWLAAMVGLLVGTHWRWAYLISVLPALLTLWVRMGIKEPERWQKAAATNQRRGSFRDLLGNPRWRKNAILGMLLAAVGLGTFWGVVIAGQDLAREMLTREKAAGIGLDATGIIKFFRNEKAAYGIIQTIGVAVGMLSFGPICNVIGRRRTFFFAFLGSMFIVPATCYLPRAYWQLLLMLPVYGFFAQAVHAGFAIYFPELFPNHLRSTGAGFCFNGGRLLAAGIMIFSGWLKFQPGIDLYEAITILTGFFGLGMIVLAFLPETKGQPLPE